MLKSVGFPRFRASTLVRTFTSWSRQQGTEANTVSVSGLEKDSKYHFFVTGICDTEGKVQTFNEYTVSTIKSDKAIPEIAITGISAPEGSAEAGPYYVWFNIKAPNKDCVRLKYLCNTKAQWVIAGNEGKGDETMFNSYGQELKDADIIQAINSDAGFNINFGSWENTVSILKIASYNEEEALKVFSGESTSPEEQDKARIESHLFNTLQGDYTTTVTITEGGYIGQPDTEHDVDNKKKISILECAVICRAVSERIRRNIHSNIHVMLSVRLSNVATFCNSYSCGVITLQCIEQMRFNSRLILFFRRSAFTGEDFQCFLLIIRSYLQN